jgi:DNA-binding SARP family transcriptional activator
MFGGLRATREGGETVGLSPQQPTALLAFLALNIGSNQVREETVERLWPEEEPERCQQKLRRSLHALRRRLEEPPFESAELLLTTRQTLGLDPNAVCTDVAEFKEVLLAATRTTDREERMRHLARAVDLYRGELLPGFYEECFVQERDHLAELYGDALNALTHLYERSGDLQRAVEYAHRAVALDPLKEEPHCTLMRLFAVMGRSSAVVMQYRELERALHEALNTAPSEATRVLMESLREHAHTATFTHIEAQSAPNRRGESVGPPTLGTGNRASTVGHWPLRTRRKRRAGKRVETPGERRQQAGRTLGQEGREHPNTQHLNTSIPQHLPHPIPPPLYRRVPALAVVAVLGLIGYLAAHRGAPHATKTAALPKPAFFVPSPKTLWVARYTPAADEIDNSEPTAMTTDEAGNVYITGFIQTQHNDADYLTLKYSPEGRLLWRARYNGPGNDVDRARSIAVDAAGNVYVTGESDNGKGNLTTRLSGLDWATIKYDPQGNQLWVARYNGPDDGEDVPVKVCVDRDGSVYVAGRSMTRSAVKRPDLLGQDFVTVKYDAVGRQIWVQRVSTTPFWLHAQAEDMVLDALGNVYVTGSYRTMRMTDFAKSDALTIKYAPGGEEIWRRTYPGQGVGDVIARRIAVDGAGNVTLTGVQDDGDLMNNGTLNDIVTLRYDAKGNETWERARDGGQSQDSPNALAVDEAGNAYVAGFGHPGVDYVTLKYHPNGSDGWVQTYNGVGNQQDVANGIALDHASNVIVVGYSYGGSAPKHVGTEDDYVTIKYDPVGHVLWKAVYDGNGLGDRAVAVAVDRSDCVVVTGQSDRGNGTPAITTVKYAP